MEFSLFLFAITSLWLVAISFVVRLQRTDIEVCRQIMDRYESELSARLRRVEENRMPVVRAEAPLNAVLDFRPVEKMLTDAELDNALEFAVAPSRVEDQ